MPSPTELKRPSKDPALTGSIPEEDDDDDDGDESLTSVAIKCNDGRRKSCMK